MRKLASGEQPSVALDSVVRLLSIVPPHLDYIGTLLSIVLSHLNDAVAKAAEYEPVVRHSASSCI